MVQARSIYRILAAGLFSITVLQLAIPHCYPPVKLYGPNLAQIRTREKSEYGRYYSGHLFCKKYTQHLSRAHAVPLSVRELDRLWELQTAPNDIAIDATTVLAAYANHGHPEVKKDQLSRMPLLLANTSPIVRGCAATIADWWHITKYDPQFRSFEQELMQKDSLTDEEKVFLWELKSHFKEPADPGNP